LVTRTSSQDHSFDRLALVALAVILAGCGGHAPKPTTINEQRGTYRGVGIGDRPETVFRVFGRVPLSGTDQPVTPLEDDFVAIGGATVIATPCKAIPPGTNRQALLRYDHVSFLLCDGRVYAVIVAVKIARTLRGVAIGDGLDEVQRSYGRLSCGDAPYGEGFFGQQPSYPYCGGKLHAKRWIWFGRDPIRSITISATALGS
jgi:hypothetical protein